jgi:hypothetical protein
METPKKYYYTYYSYEECGRGYIGSRGCKCLPEEDVRYFGSFRDRTFKPTQKIILKDDYATREEAIVDEIILHDYYDVAINPDFANRAKQTSTKFSYISTREEAIKNGKKIKELGVGVHRLSQKELSDAGKKGGAKTKELGIGIFTLTDEERKELGKKSGMKSYELGIGIHGRTKEQMIEDAKKGGEVAGKLMKELGKGIFALTTEQRSENGKKYGKIGGIKTYELGIGIHGLTLEQKIENSKKGAKIGGEIGGKLSYELELGIHGLSSKQTIENASKGGKIVSKQLWQCTETGFIANAGNLARYQRARGIDTSKRIRLE